MGAPFARLSHFLERFVIPFLVMGEKWAKGGSSSTYRNFDDEFSSQFASSGRRNVELDYFERVPCNT